MHSDTRLRSSRVQRARLSTESRAWSVQSSPGGSSRIPTYGNLSPSIHSLADIRRIVDSTALATLSLSG